MWVGMPSMRRRKPAQACAGLNSRKLRMSVGCTAKKKSGVIGSQSHRNFRATSGRKGISSIGSQVSHHDLH